MDLPTVSSDRLKSLLSEKVDVFDLPNIAERTKWNGISQSGNKWVIYHGSALDVLKTMPEKTVN